MKKPILLFDFDGTIADTFHNILHIINRLAEEFHFRPIGDNEVSKLKDMTSQEIVYHLKVPIMKIPMLVTRGKQELQKEMAAIQPAPGLHDILHQIKKLGFRMGILSSNSETNVMTFLNNHDMNLFDFINTTPKIWSKNTCLKNLLRQKKLSPDQILYIGDETRDIKAAHRVGIPVAAVTWGYNSVKALQNLRPNYIIHQPQELFILCQSLNGSPQP